MTGTAARMQRERASAVGDERLIKQCLKGDQQAWAALIEKYKNLIYSIPIKMGMYQDAGDIFQAVCVDLLTELPKLREHRALPKWLMQTGYHKCLHYQKNASRHVELDPEDAENQESDEALPEHMLVALEKEQSVRDAIAEISSRCQQMIRMLFFELPPRPYDEVAKELGLATGSIGFIRGRCLTKLKKELEKKGF
jgi:RNA polymerase sigma factor (sigma-70 family)